MFQASPLPRPTTHRVSSSGGWAGEWAGLEQALKALTAISFHVLPNQNLKRYGECTSIAILCNQRLINMNQNPTHSAMIQGGIQSRMPPDAGRFPAAHAGWFLKRERLSRRLALNKVAAQLKIRERYLWAIEEGVDGEFPPSADFFSYVDAYARYLEFDPKLLIEHYREIFPAMLEAQKRGPGNIIALWPAMRARSRSFAVVTAVFLVAIISAGFWLSTGTSTPDGSRIATIPAPNDLNNQGSTDLASRQGANPLTTGSLSSAAKNALSAESIQVRTIDLIDAMAASPKLAAPLRRPAVEAELDAAALNN